MKGCPRSFTYMDTLTALDLVHARLLARQSGADPARNPVTLVWDEYMAQMLNLLAQDKKAAAAAMNKDGRGVDAGPAPWVSGSPYPANGLTLWHSRRAPD